MSKRKRSNPGLRHPLRYPLPSPRKVRGMLVLMSVLVLMHLLLWWLTAAPALAPALLVFGVWCLAMHLLWHLNVWPEGTFLYWSGTNWAWQRGDGQDASDVIERLSIAIDFQVAILLKADGLADRRAGWLLLMRRSNPESWPGIRRVLYSSLVADDEQASGKM